MEINSSKVLVCAMNLIYKNKKQEFDYSEVSWAKRILN